MQGPTRVYTTALVNITVVI